MSSLVAVSAGDVDAGQDDLGKEGPGKRDGLICVIDFALKIEEIARIRPSPIPPHKNALYT
jgi:hypothetical protein